MGTRGITGRRGPMRFAAVLALCSMLLPPGGPFGGAPRPAEASAGVSETGIIVQGIQAWKNRFGRIPALHDRYRAEPSKRDPRFDGDEVVASFQDRNGELDGSDGGAPYPWVYLKYGDFHNAVRAMGGGGDCSKDCKPCEVKYKGKCIGCCPPPKDKDGNDIVPNCCMKRPPVPHYQPPSTTYSHSFHVANHYIPWIPGAENISGAYRVIMAYEEKTLRAAVTKPNVEWTHQNWRERDGKLRDMPIITPDKNSKEKNIRTSGITLADLRNMEKSDVVVITDFPVVAGKERYEVRGSHIEHWIDRYHYETPRWVVGYGLDPSPTGGAKGLGRIESDRRIGFVDMWQYGASVLNPNYLKFGTEPPTTVVTSCDLSKATTESVNGLNPLDYLWPGGYSDGEVMSKEWHVLDRYAGKKLRWDSRLVHCKSKFHWIDAPDPPSGQTVTVDKSWFLESLDPDALERRDMKDKKGWKNGVRTTFDLNLGWWRRFTTDGWGAAPRTPRRSAPAEHWAGLSGEFEKYILKFNKEILASRDIYYEAPEWIKKVTAQENKNRKPKDRIVLHPNKPKHGAGGAKYYEPIRDAVWRFDVNTCGRTLLSNVEMNSMYARLARRLAPETFEMADQMQSLRMRDVDIRIQAPAWAHLYNMLRAKSYAPATFEMSSRPTEAPQPYIRVTDESVQGAGIWPWQNAQYELGFRSNRTILSDRLLYLPPDEAFSLFVGGDWNKLDGKAVMKNLGVWKWKFDTITEREYAECSTWHDAFMQVYDFEDEVDILANPWNEWRKSHPLYYRDVLPYVAMRLGMVMIPTESALGSPDPALSDDVTFWGANGYEIGFEHTPLRRSKDPLGPAVIDMSRYRHEKHVFDMPREAMRALEAGLYDDSYLRPAVPLPPDAKPIWRVVTNLTKEETRKIHDKLPKISDARMDKIDREISRATGKWLVKQTPIPRNRNAPEKYGMVVPGYTGRARIFPMHVRKALDYVSKANVFSPDDMPNFRQHLPLWKHVPPMQVNAGEPVWFENEHRYAYILDGTGNMGGIPMALNPDCLEIPNPEDRPAPVNSKRLNKLLPDGSYMRYRIASHIAPGAYTPVLFAPYPSVRYRPTADRGTLYFFGVHTGIIPRDLGRAEYRWTGLTEDPARGELSGILYRTNSNWGGMEASSKRQIAIGGETYTVNGVEYRPVRGGKKIQGSSMTPGAMQNANASGYSNPYAGRYERVKKKAERDERSDAYRNLLAKYERNAKSPILVDGKVPYRNYPMDWMARRPIPQVWNIRSYNDALPGVPELDRPRLQMKYMRDRIDTGINFVTTTSDDGRARIDTMTMTPNVGEFSFASFMPFRGLFAPVLKKDDYGSREGISPFARWMAPDEDGKKYFQTVKTWTDRDVPKSYPWPETYDWTDEHGHENPLCQSKPQVEIFGPGSEATTIEALRGPFLKAPSERAPRYKVQDDDNMIWGGPASNDRSALPEPVLPGAPSFGERVVSVLAAPFRYLGAAPAEAAEPDGEDPGVTETGEISGDYMPKLPDPVSDDAEDGIIEYPAVPSSEDNAPAPPASADVPPASSGDVSPDVSPDVPPAPPASGDEKPKPDKKTELTRDMVTVSVYKWSDRKPDGEPYYVDDEIGFAVISVPELNVLYNHYRVVHGIALGSTATPWRWRSSNSNVFAIQADGTGRCVSPGTATVTCYFTQDPLLSGTYAITVQKRPTEEISVPNKGTPVELTNVFVEVFDEPDRMYAPRAVDGWPLRAAPIAIDKGRRGRIDMAEFARDIAFQPSWNSGIIEAFGSVKVPKLARVPWNKHRPSLYRDDPNYDIAFRDMLRNLHDATMRRRIRWSTAAHRLDYEMQPLKEAKARFELERLLLFPEVLDVWYADERLFVKGAVPIAAVERILYPVPEKFWDPSKISDAVDATFDNVFVWEDKNYWDRMKFEVPARLYGKYEGPLTGGSSKKPKDNNNWVGAASVGTAGTAGGKDGPVKPIPSKRANRLYVPVAETDYRQSPLSSYRIGLAKKVVELADKGRLIGFPTDDVERLREVSNLGLHKVRDAYIPPLTIQVLDRLLWSNRKEGIQPGRLVKGLNPALPDSYPVLKDPAPPGADPARKRFFVTERGVFYEYKPNPKGGPEWFTVPIERNHPVTGFLFDAQRLGRSMGLTIIDHRSIALQDDSNEAVVYYRDRWNRTFLQLGNNAPILPSPIIWTDDNWM